MPVAHHPATNRARPASTSSSVRSRRRRGAEAPATALAGAADSTTTATAADARLPPVPCKGQPKVLLKGLRISLRRIRWPVAATIGTAALLVAFVVVAATVDRHALRLSVELAVHDP